MLIELKNLKTLASLSEETHCYTATIYVDGKPAFNASNHGHGGCDNYDPIAPFTYADVKRIDEELAKSKPVISSGTRPDGSTWELTHSLEIEVGGLINDEIARKRLNRILKGKVAVLGEHKGQPALFTFNAKPTPENIARLLATKPQYKGKVVNGDADLEKKALALV